MIAKYFSGLFYLISILFGNLFVIWFGIIQISISPVDFNNLTNIIPWFILIFPAGALWIGLTFSARDFAQRFWGHYKIWWWMICAAIITAFLNWKLALASVAAFIVSEFVDWFIFVVLKKDLKWKIIISNSISCPLDSIVFIMIAFGASITDPAIWGQAVVKYLSGLLVLPIIPFIEKIYNKYNNTYNCIPKYTEGYNKGGYNARS